MRLQLLRLFFFIIFTVIVIRLFYWQVIRFEELSVRAEKQHLIRYSIKAPRGLIYSADGSLLAANKPTFLLYGLPKMIEDKEQVAEKLAKVISSYRIKEILIKEKFADSQKEATSSSLENIKDSKQVTEEEIEEELKQDFLQKLSQDLYWVALYRNLDFSVKEEIEKLQIEGIGFENGLSRFYPESSSSAHTLGFVGSDALGRETGYFGIEGYYNKELRGIGGELVEERDARGVPILSGKFVKTDAQNGHDLTLTIDMGVQYIVEKKLKEGMEKYKAASGSVVVMDPKTGAILAMAAYPNYDPNDFYNFPAQYYTNPITAETYEPGSTFKVLIMAAALNEGVVKPDTKCDICDGPVESSGYLIRTWNNKYYKDSTMTDVIVHSDNTGMVFVGRKLGLDKMYQYIKDFGFGSLTGIDIQDEALPSLRDKDEWRDIDLATASFGQGIAVTPIQMIQAVSAIANDGILVKPRVVKEVHTKDGPVSIKPKEVGQPISKEAARMVTEMMVAAVEKGEAKAFAPKGYKIAGKTGTAQIPVAGHYDPEKTIASFVGFAPADDPKFIMLVRYREPQSSIFGSETAAPTFFAIAKELFTYFNIPPSE